MTRFGRFRALAVSAAVFLVALSLSLPRASADGYTFPNWPFSGYVNPETHTDYPFSTIGKLYFTDPTTGLDYWCSGSVINSGNFDMVWTAGHCVWGGRADQGTGHFMTNFEFIPALDGQSTPFGIWNWRLAQSTAGYETSNDNQDDFGVVLFNTDSNGDHLAGLTGFLGFVFGAVREHEWHIIGYPSAPSNGFEQYICTTSFAATWVNNNSEPDQNGVGCDADVGGSGSPFIRSFSSVAGGDNDQVESVYSTTDRNGHIWGPYMGSQAATLYNAMTSA